MSDRTPRFSDVKLQEFYDEFEAHRMEQQELHNELLLAIKDNTTAVASLARKTEEIIEVWNASKKAMKFLGWIGNGLKWIAGVGIAIGSIWYFITHGGEWPHQ